MITSWLAALRPVLTITRREVRDQLRDWRIIVPIILLTIFFPGLMNFTAEQAVGFVEEYGAELVIERLIPFLLMIVGFFPISISLVIALESFVGEKERRSIEPLLSSPLADWQLYFGKLLAAMVPPLIGSYLGIGVYLYGVYTSVGWQAAPMLLVQILVLTMVQAVVMVSGAVVISAQTTSVRAANLLASFIIIPMALLIQGESVIMFWSEYDTLWWVILGEIVIAGLLIRTGIAHFNREELLGRELDSLNFRWAGQVLRQSLRKPTEPFGVYLRRRVSVPFLLMFLILVISIAVGASQVARFPLPAEAFRTTDLQVGMVEGLSMLRLFSLEGVLTVWFHNIRAVVLASILGVFSFGVLGVLVLMLPLGLVGYFVAAAGAVGFDPLTFFTAFVLPHGILEIPAIAIAGAAILRLGAILATPANGMTIGEAWLRGLADWIKIILLLVIPLLLGAAFLEVYVTPQVALWFFGA